MGLEITRVPNTRFHALVTNAHRVEVEVGADGHASAPPSGAAASTPPAGAERFLVNYYYAFVSHFRVGNGH
jgi:hypothetical protein